MKKNDFSKDELKTFLNDLDREVLKECLPDDLHVANPLMAFIEEEVPYRLNEIHDIAASDEIIEELIACVQNETDVMFAYDKFDNFLLEKYDEITEKENCMEVVAC